jgi:hypothetical protein
MVFENFDISKNILFFVLGIGTWGIFWNPSYGHLWTIPKRISKLNTSFSSLTTSFKRNKITSFSYELS